MMKLAVIAPAEISSKFEQVLLEEFTGIKTVFFTYESFEEIPGFLKERQSEFDAALFSGKTALVYTGKHITPTIPWEYSPRDGSALLQVFLKIALSGKMSLLHLSLDLVDKKRCSEIFEEIGIDEKLAENYFIKTQHYDNQFVEMLTTFHSQNYFYKNTSCCITAFYAVQQNLLRQNIPCFLLKPTVGAIRQAINKIQLNYEVSVSQQSQIVAIYIQIDQPSEYSVLNDNEYQYIINRTNVTREVYTFAQRIKAAVVEIGVQAYLLFSTRYVLENFTNNFETIDILESVKSHTASTISLGVGYGATAQEAKLNAKIGMQRADKIGGDTAFLVYEDKNIVGPLNHNSNKEVGKITPNIDPNFLAVSQKTSLSIETIFQLHSIVKQQGKEQFTSAELAGLLNISRRTVNRIITKLLLKEYGFEIGRRIVNKQGRPERIIQLNLP